MNVGDKYYLWVNVFQCIGVAECQNEVKTFITSSVYTQIVHVVYVHK